MLRRASATLHELSDRTPFPRGDQRRRLTDFTTNYVVVGDLATEATLSAFGFVVGPPRVINLRRLVKRQRVFGSDRLYHYSELHACPKDPGVFRSRQEPSNQNCPTAKAPPEQAAAARTD